MRSRVLVCICLAPFAASYQLMQTAPWRHHLLHPMLRMAEVAAPNKLDAFTQWLEDQQIASTDDEARTLLQHVQTRMAGTPSPRVAVVSRAS